MRDDLAELGAAFFVEQRMTGDIGEIKIALRWSTARSRVTFEASCTEKP